MALDIGPQVQHGETIPVSRPGKKRKKTTGAGSEPVRRVPRTIRPNSNCQPLSARIPKGSYVDDGVLWIDDLPEKRRKPITLAAKKLLGDYQRRMAFWRAVKEMGTPIEFAGRELLGLTRGRADEILKEMPHGPLFWFYLQFVEGLAKRSILGARETLRSNVADAFYRELAGGRNGLGSLRETMGCQSVIRLREVLKNPFYDKDIVGMEIICYSVHAGLFPTQED
jgi:hypothetical protein